MRCRAALILLPLAAFAQKPAPEVDQALRARVTEFFQYHVDGNFRKAYDMVAEDTKDYYFATQKVLFKSFKIESINYADDLTHAEVNLSGERLIKFRSDFPETVVAVPMKTTWKIENGKWVWYDVSKPENITPMGKSDVDRLREKSTPAAGTSAPQAGLSPAEIASRAAQILQQSSIDRSELVLQLDRPSSEKVVFHNGQAGSIKLVLDPGSKPVGCTVELDKTDLAAGENATVKIRFDPPAGSASVQPSNFTIRLTMEPFSRVFPINVKFAAPAKPGLP
jgi:hypothetical protein